MKQRVSQPRLTVAGVPQCSTPWKLLRYVAAGSLFCGFLLYGPALRGDFVFDDFSLPFHLSSRAEPLAIWLAGVRPVLMFTYWLNDRVWGEGPASYHAINVLIHAAVTSLVFLVLYRWFELAGWAARKRPVAAVIGAAVFLIHPLATESVSYVAGRSESLAALLMLMAYTVFLYRAREAISWKEAVAVTVLFGLAVGSKENAVALAGILLLTDVFWQRPFSLRGVRANWRLYVVMAPGAIFGTVTVLRMLATAPTAGVSLKTITWYQYFFTQARAIFVYVRMAVLPVGQSVDHDFAASRSVMEHGAIFYMAALGLIVMAAVAARRRFPLSCFGLLFFLILLSPTSSVIPIADFLVERRMYLPLAGLIPIACEMGARMRVSRAAAWSGLSAALLLLGALCYQRNCLWGNTRELLASAALQARGTSRPLANLTDQLIAENRCEAARPYLEAVGRVLPRDYGVELSWGRVLECLGRREEAMVRLQRAASINPTSKVFELIGLLYGEMHRSQEAGGALWTAVQLDKGSITAHRAMAIWYESVGDLAMAEREYLTILRLDHNDDRAPGALGRIRQAMATGLSTGKMREDGESW